jgi:hypothetical protein
MEISKGNSLCYLKLEKKVIFLFLSFLFPFLKNWRTGGPGERVETMGGGKWWGRG